MHAALCRWEAATERFLDAAEPGPAAPGQRLEAGLDSMLATLHNTLTGECQVSEFRFFNVYAPKYLHSALLLLVGQGCLCSSSS